MAITIERLPNKSSSAMEGPSCSLPLRHDTASTCVTSSKHDREFCMDAQISFDQIVLQITVTRTDKLPSRGKGSDSWWERGGWLLYEPGFTFDLSTSAPTMRYSGRESSVSSQLVRYHDRIIGSKTLRPSFGAIHEYHKYSF